MCLRRAPEEYIAGAALDRAAVEERKTYPRDFSTWPQYSCWNFLVQSANGDFSVKRILLLQFQLDLRSACRILVYCISVDCKQMFIAS
jgi:hypothetical protein